MKRFLTEMTVFLLVLLFTYASMSKFLDYNKFVFQMKLSPFIPIKLAAGFLAWSVPVLEIYITVTLLFKRTRRTGLYASLIILSLFEFYIAAMLFSGMHLPCTCGGIISKMSWREHLLFNAFFIVLTSISIRNLKYITAASEQESFISYSRA